MTEGSIFDLTGDIDSKEARHVRDGIRKKLIVKPGSAAGLADRDSAWNGGPEPEALSAKELKEAAKEFLAQGVKKLADAQELLWATDTYALLIVFQAMDAAGKDSTIKHVMSGVNPQGVQVVSFKHPSNEELDHDFLWRQSEALPERGRIGIFNRSHYEEVIAVRVHPDWLANQKLPPGPRGAKLWKRRFEDINAWERHLDRDGTKVVKFFLHLSKREQKKRFLARLDRPDKLWKFSVEDINERAYWDEYMEAYEDAISATSTEPAPWYVIPADHKPLMHAMVVGIILDTIAELDLKWPKISDEDRAAHEAARRGLEAEAD